MEKNRRNSVKQEADKTMIEGYDYLGNSASSMDCTGLIPSEPRSDAEREAYEELYHYCPRAISSRKERETKREE